MSDKTNIEENMLAKANAYDSLIEKIKEEKERTLNEGKADREKHTEDVMFRQGYYMVLEELLDTQRLLQEGEICEKQSLEEKEQTIGEWAYGNLIIDEEKYYICLQVNDHIKRDDYEVYMVEVLPETIGQYTGLHDTNGTEIYEGDIVEGLFIDQEEPEMIGTVIYSDYQASYIVIAKNNDEWELGYLDELEVIGNIYENSDLLKDQPMARK